MQIHELNNFTGTLGSGAYLAIDDGNDTGKISSQGLLAATEARIDNIIAGPAPSAEEIVDARLGDDGVTYPSLGDAIRDQFSDVKSAIKKADDALATGVFDLYLKYELTVGKYYNRNGELTNSANWRVTPLIEFPENFTLTYSGITTTGSNPSAVWFDANQAVIETFRATTGTNIITPPTGAKYIAFSIQEADVNSFSFRYDLNEFDKTKLNIEGFDILSGWALGELSGNNVVSSTKSIIVQVTRNTPSIVKVLDTASYQFYVSVFDSTGTTRLVDSGWLTDKAYTVEANTPFYITAANSDRSTLSSEEIAELKQNVVISNDIGNATVKTNRKFSDEFSYKCVNHMGYTVEAPEDSIAGYKLSKQQGYEIVETDIHFTSDGVAVLLHDDTINRVARNLDGTTISETVNIADITYAEALNYDFGIYKGAEWSCKIATFEEFIILCKKLNLYAYVEIKQGIGLDETKWNGLKTVVSQHGMDERITWITSSSTYAQRIRLYSPTERLGYVVSSSSIDVEFCNLIVNSGFNDGFLDISYLYLTDAIVANAQDCGLAIEVWVVDDAETLNGIDSYVSGVTTDTLKADEVFSTL